MEIIWDEQKRQRNIAKHGFDFADLDADYFLMSKVIPAKSGRYMAIGEFRDEAVVVVVFAPLGSEGLSVISMRPASRKERSIL